MDGWTLGLLVDYIYTAEIQVTEDNVQVITQIIIVTHVIHVLSESLQTFSVTVINGYSQICFIFQISTG